MSILHDTLKRSAIIIIAVLALSILYNNDYLKLAIAKYLSPSPTYSSNEELFKRHRAECEERNKDFPSLCSAEINEDTIKIKRNLERLAHYREYIYPKEKIIETASGLLLGLSVSLLAIRLFLNLHMLLKGRPNMNFLVFLRRFFSFFSSRKAELEFMRYKRLFENGVITETEFFEKKKELKSKIIG